MSQAEPERPQGLHAKIAAIQKAADINNLPKRHVSVQTSGGGTYTYDYIEESTLMEVVRPLLADHGIAVYYSDEILQQGGNTATVRTKLTLVDAATGEEHTLSTDGFAADKGDKMVNKAKTGAMRYLLWKWFLVPSSMDDPETESVETSSNAPKSHTKMATDQQVEAFLVAVENAGFDRAAAQKLVDTEILDWEGVRADWLAGQQRDLQAAVQRTNAAT